MKLSKKTLGLNTEESKQDGAANKTIIGAALIKIIKDNIEIEDKNASSSLDS